MTVQNFLDTSSPLKFISDSVEDVCAQVTELYTTITKRTLAPSDPIQLFLNTIVYVLVMQRVGINHAGKMNLLRYAKGVYLDEIGYGLAQRLPACGAFCTIKVTLSSQFPDTKIIPKGIRVSTDDNVIFALMEPVVIPSGGIAGTAKAMCIQLGKIGNGYIPGEIHQVVDFLPYISSMENIDISNGGTDVEDDESYRNRIRLAPESFSVAGPAGAYAFWAKKVYSQIADVCVVSPIPGTVNIFAILEGGILPNSQILKEIENACNDRRIRPLTDKVNVCSPDIVKYDVDITYYIDRSASEVVKTNISQAIKTWILWTKSKIGRDINTTEVITRCREAGARRVEIKNPHYTKISSGQYDISTKKILPVQIAVADKINVVFGGVEDD